MTSTEMGFSHITCWTFISLQHSVPTEKSPTVVVTHQTQVEARADQRGVRGSRCGDEYRLGAAVPHTVLWICIVFDRWRQVLRHPLVGPGLRVAGGDELDARLLEGEDSCADGAQAAEADQGEFETRLGGHFIQYSRCMYLQEVGNCADVGPAPGALINLLMLRISGNKYTRKVDSCCRAQLSGRIFNTSGPTVADDIRSGVICPVVRTSMSDRLPQIRSIGKNHISVCLPFKLEIQYVIITMSPFTWLMMLATVVS